MRLTILLILKYRKRNLVLVNKDAYQRETTDRLAKFEHYLITQSTQNFDFRVKKPSTIFDKALTPF